jgi:hypothetical protein
MNFLQISFNLLKTIKSQMIWDCCIENFGIFMFKKAGQYVDFWRSLNGGGGGSTLAVTFLKHRYPTTVTYGGFFPSSAMRLQVPSIIRVKVKVYQEYSALFPLLFTKGLGVCNMSKKGPLYNS